MNIDWSKAPEGATHFAPADSKQSLRACWYKINEYTREFIPEDMNPDFWQPQQRHRVELIARPTSEWVGDGCPPAGTSCEFSYHKYPEMWRVGVIRYISKNTCVIEVGEAREVIEHPTTLKFRPIRTIEQIAASARNKAAAEMSEATQGAKDWHEAFKMLHDKGYRRFEIVDA